MKNKIIISQIIIKENKLYQVLKKFEKTSAFFFVEKSGRYSHVF